MIECLWDDKKKNACIHEGCPYYENNCPVFEYPEICIYFTDKEEEAIYIYESADYED